MIREWARSQGYQVGDRGLIPRHIIDAYKKAHHIGQAIRPRVFRVARGRWHYIVGGIEWRADSWRSAIDAVGSWYRDGS